MLSDTRCLIIGAGPAGLTAAYHLVRAGIRPILLEQSATVGGISQTAEYKGYRFDIGGHRFYSKSQEIEDLWTEILGDEMLTRPRLSRIYYGGRFYDYPIKAANAFRNLGPLESGLCVASYVKARLLPRRSIKSFEDWVSNAFGFRLYATFFRTYTEKVWGMPCTDLSADWAAQRIKGLSLSAVMLSALGINLAKRDGEVIKTLIDRFRYPRLGPGMMWEKVAANVTEAGGAVVLQTRVVAIRRSLDGARLDVTCQHGNGEEPPETLTTDQLISTMPLRELVTALGRGVPSSVVGAANDLHYRDFLTVALVVDHANLFPDNWIYIHDPAVRVGRIQNFKNWSPDLVADPERTCLGLEYFCFEGDGLWTMPDEDLITLGTLELARLGLTKGAKVIDGTVVRMPKAYPVYDDKYKDNVLLVRRYLETQWPQIQVAGRNGMHKYDNQDHAMMTGLICARNITDTARPKDPWRVNADAEYQEEISEETSDARLVPRKI